MSKSTRDKAPVLQISTEVVRQIRQHARSNGKTEVCGVLIGAEGDGVTSVQACIAGVNAAQGGSHVTFTQDTWEHIYKIKDRDYPDERIVGWYHSHPGFGVFLSDHDTFIHKNFFSSPQQVAWVYDPHSDEEGCFGWKSGRLERVAQFVFMDCRGGQRADAVNKEEPVRDRSDANSDANDEWQKSSPRDDRQEDVKLSQLTKIVSDVFSHLAVFLLGGLLVWYLLPRILVMPVPVDPQTGQPIKGMLERPPARPDSSREQRDAGPPAPQSGQRNPAETKKDDGHQR
jgi:proteasome lid subunit RPN8/RPN11